MLSVTIYTFVVINWKNMSRENIIRIKTLTQLFDALGWEKPTHPLIGVIDVTKLEELSEEKKQAFEGVKMISDLYSIILKDGDCGMQYGRNKYDFEEGVLRFIAPNQIVSSSSHTPSTYGFMLIFHPDLIRNFDLGKTIAQYNFFNYSVHEALHLSKLEENTLLEIVKNIEKRARVQYRQAYTGSRGNQYSALVKLFKAIL